MGLSTRVAARYRRAVEGQSQTVAIIEGGLGENTKILTQLVIDDLEMAGFRVERLDPAKPWADLRATMHDAAGYVFATGTYWDSWSSKLQRMLEEMTLVNEHYCMAGKPAAVLVTEHSMGAKGIISRLQGVLSMIGVLIPPMTGFMYSMAAHEAYQAMPDNALRSEFLNLHDLSVVSHNLVEAIRGTHEWESYREHDSDPQRVWLK